MREVDKDRGRDCLRKCENKKRDQHVQKLLERETKRQKQSFRRR